MTWIPASCARRKAVTEAVALRGREDDGVHLPGDIGVDELELLFRLAVHGGQQQLGACLLSRLLHPESDQAEELVLLHEHAGDLQAAVLVHRRPAGCRREHQQKANPDQEAELWSLSHGRVILMELPAVTTSSSTCGPGTECLRPAPISLLRDSVPAASLLSDTGMSVSLRSTLWPQPPREEGDRGPVQMRY